MTVVHWMAEKSLIICGALLVEFARNPPSRVPGAAAAVAGRGALLTGGCRVAGSPGVQKQNPFPPVSLHRPLLTKLWC